MTLVIKNSFELLSYELKDRFHPLPFTKSGYVNVTGKPKILSNTQDVIAEQSAIRNLKFRIQKSEARSQNLKSEIRNPKSKISSSEFFNLPYIK
jgi:hypothetical protein